MIISLFRKFWNACCMLLCLLSEPYTGFARWYISKHPFGELVFEKRIFVRNDYNIVTFYCITYQGLGWHSMILSNRSSMWKTIVTCPHRWAGHYFSFIFWCFYPKKTLFLGQKVNGKKLMERGGTPLTDGRFPKTERKKVNGKGVTPLPWTDGQFPKNPTEES